jgi:hypothetical protein
MLREVQQAVAPPGSAPAGPVREVRPAGAPPGSPPAERPGSVPRAQQEPSWPTVIATTIRLWLERRTHRDRGARNTTVSRRWIRVATLAVVILAAAGLAVALSRGGTKTPRRHGVGAGPVLAAQAARVQAAGWISQQVGRDTIVSCDPVMCPVLAARGFPAGNLDSLGPSAPDPLDSDLIAATAVLRSQFGPRLASVYAPVVIARFGTGSAEVDIRVVAPDGSPAYMRQLRADLADRKAYGRAILHNSKVLAGPAARRQLASGTVDSRLLATIVTAAEQVDPVRILSFGGAAPGASAGVPLRSAVISGAAARSTPPVAVLNRLLAFWRGQQAPYLPASTQIVPDASGQSVLRIQYAAPSSLGLLAADHPIVKIPSR